MNRDEKTNPSGTQMQTRAQNPTGTERLAEPEMLTTEEKWERAGLTDTFIFYKVMTENPDTCRRLLELLLHVKIEKIEILGGKILRNRHRIQGHTAGCVRQRRKPHF